jgi:hypothetical protein
VPYNHVGFVERIFGVGEVGTKSVDGRERQIRPGRQVATGSTDRTYPAVQSAIRQNTWISRYSQESSDNDSSQQGQVLTLITLTISIGFELKFTWTEAGITLEMASEIVANTESQIITAIGWSAFQSGQVNSKTGTRKPQRAPIWVVVSNKTAGMSCMADRISKVVRYALT